MAALLSVDRWNGARQVACQLCKCGVRGEQQVGCRSAAWFKGLKGENSSECRLGSILSLIGTLGSLGSICRLRDADVEIGREEPEQERLAVNIFCLYQSHR